MSVEKFLLRKEVTGLRIPRGLDRPDVDLYQDSGGLNFNYRDQTTGGQIGAQANIGMERRYTNLPPGFSIRADVPMSPWDCARNPGSTSCRVPEVRPSPFQTDADYYVSGCQICVKLTQTVGLFQFSVLLCHTRSGCIEEPIGERYLYDTPVQHPQLPSDPLPDMVAPPGYCRLLLASHINFYSERRFKSDGRECRFSTYEDRRKPGYTTGDHPDLRNPQINDNWRFGFGQKYTEGYWFLDCREVGTSLSFAPDFRTECRFFWIDVPGNCEQTGFNYWLEYIESIRGNWWGSLFLTPLDWITTDWDIPVLVKVVCSDIGECPYIPPERPKPPLPTPTPREREDDDMRCCGCDCATIALIQARNTRIILNAIGDLSLIRKIHDGLGIQQLPYYVPDSYLPNSNYTGITTFKEMWSVMHNAAHLLGNELYTKLGLDKYPYENMPASFYGTEEEGSINILNQATFNQLIYSNLIDYFKKAYKVQGIGEYPVNVPENLLVPMYQEASSTNKEINNLPEFITYIITQLYDVLGGGSFPAKITIEDSNLVQEGNQPKTSTIPNLGEAILQILANSMMSQADSAALINITTSTLLEAGMTKKLAAQIDRTTKANAEFLDYDVKEVEEELPLTFTPGAEQLDKFLKDSKDKVKYWENIDKLTLSDAINKINEIAAVVNGALRRPINPKGDVKQQIIDLIKGLASIADGKINLGTEEEATDDFSLFTERVEKGFTDAPGTTDTNSFYGRSYDERPRIRDIGDRTASGDDSNG